MENNPDFENLGEKNSTWSTLGFILKNIEGESMKARDLSHIL